MFMLEDVSVSVSARPVLSSTLSGVSSLIISNSLSQLSSSATSAHPTSHQVSSTHQQQSTSSSNHYQMQKQRVFRELRKSVNFYSAFAVHFYIEIEY